MPPADYLDRPQWGSRWQGFRVMGNFMRDLCCGEACAFIFMLNLVTVQRNSSDARWGVLVNTGDCSYLSICIWLLWVFGCGYVNIWKKLILWLLLLTFQSGSYDLNPEGMKTFKGKNPSRYSYLVQGHENPYFLPGDGKTEWKTSRPAGEEVRVEVRNVGSKKSHWFEILCVQAHFLSRTRSVFVHT